MASLELDWASEADSTEVTADDQDEDSTEVTADDEIRMAADSTDETQEKFLDADSTDETTSDWAERTDRRARSKIPSSEIVVRTIAVERSAPLAALPADANAAFSQWLSGSGLAPAKH